MGALFFYGKFDVLLYVFTWFLPFVLGRKDYFFYYLERN